jgi:hypothetical protein
MALGELKPQQPAFPYTAPLTQTLNDETLPIINKPKHPKKRGKTRNKMEGPNSKKTKEPPKRANHKANIKFPTPLARSISNKVMGGLPERRPSLEEP